MKSRALTLIVGELPLTPDPYTVLILTSAEENRARIDELIQESSHEWTLDRLAVVDRLIMTLALAELILDDPPPTAVVLDEAGRTGQGVIPPRSRHRSSTAFSPRVLSTYSE